MIGRLLALFVLLPLALSLSACQASTRAAETPSAAPTHIETANLFGLITATPTLVPSPTATIPPTPSPTISPAFLDRPAFLAWPLPSYIGLARISQYPNTGWSWHYLGLNDGYQCPLAFGYLLNVDSWQYWRDPSIPRAQDMAQADPHQFEMVECYSSGGPIGLTGHEGTDIKSEAGTPVYAAADGKVQDWHLNGLNTRIVLKHCLGGTWDANNECVGGRQWYTTYMHIVTNKDLLATNTDVAQGAVVGNVFDQGMNTHLHFEVGLDKRSYLNYKNPWGTDSAPWMGCLWMDQLLCPYPDPAYNQILFYRARNLSLQQGGMPPVKILDAPPLRQIRLSEKLIAVTDADGILWVRENGKWKLAAKSVVDFQLSNHRLAVLDWKKKLLVKENGLDGDWQLQAENVRAFSMSEHRLGCLTEKGNVLVKEGSLQQDWVNVAQNITAFQLNDNHIALLDQNGALFVNEGQLATDWQKMADHVKAFQLTNLRLGILDSARNLLVKEGNLRAEWLLQAKNVVTFQLADYRMLIHAEGEPFKFKAGNLYQTWVDLPADLKNVVMNADAPVYVP